MEINGLELKYVELSNDELILLDLNSNLPLNFTRIKHNKCVIYDS